ncbi:MAG TPA: hypothetical protein VKB87_03070 [Myxococcaceae bacterium]|nr:hypothetical protein [Myxococcaceae bacterium]
MAMTGTKPEHGFATKRNVAAILWVALMALTGLQATAAGEDEQSTTAVIARLKESKISLADGIRQSEKQYGPAISAKFELEDGALNLSVYNAKEGRNKDAEHNVLTEAAGDATKAPWTPKMEVFEDKEHLKRAATQLTLVQTSKLGLADVVQKVSDRGTVYSVTPTIVGNAPVFELLVATADGKSAKFIVDARTGTVSGGR